MNMRPLIPTLAAALLAASAIHAAGPLSVVTTTEDLAAIAREVGGDRVKVEALSRGYQDPHFVEAKPSFVLRLNKADLLIAVGRELELGWLPPLITQSRNAKIQPGANGYLDASLTARILEIHTGHPRAKWATSTRRATRITCDPTNGGGGHGHREKLSSLRREDAATCATQRISTAAAASAKRCDASGALQGIMSSPTSLLPNPGALA